MSKHLIPRQAKVAPLDACKRAVWFVENRVRSTDYHGASEMCCWVFCILLSGHSTELTKSETILLNDCIYHFGLHTMFPTEGKYARATILVIPEEMKRLYKSKPYHVIRYLSNVVRYSREGDSRMAFAYVVGLCNSPLNAMSNVNTFGNYELSNRGRSMLLIRSSEYTIINIYCVFGMTMFLQA